MLASINMATAATSANAPASSTTLIATPVAQPTPNFHVDMKLTRSTNLIDFQDGTRSDSLDYEITPLMKTSYGSLITSITYSQNLRDMYSRTASDWGDVPLIFAFKPTNWQWSDNTAKISYSVSAVLPLSQNSVKKDQLQTAISGKIGFSLAPKESSGFGYTTSISLGRNIHAFEEDINGSILNKYSSNQNLGINYSISDWSMGIDFTNRTRLTYKNSVKSFFEISEEIGYSVNNNISFALGHTNAGSTIKENGTDSNIDLYNENNSSVYATLGLSY